MPSGIDPMATTANQSQPRGRLITAARKHAATNARIDIQRQGNCTNRSFGSQGHSGALTRSIRKVEAPASNRELLHTNPTGDNRRVGGGSVRDASAAAPVSKISSSAQAEAIQLNQVCS